MMYRTTLLSTVLASLIACTGISLAASSEFTTRTLIGGDATPPTAPTALVATPVATTQIDLTWASSTDDFILSGYHVWRDDVQIATTTDTFYQDIGLIASTTYSYYIVAFDSSFNFSASSSVTATTTLSPAPPPGPGGGPIYGSKHKPWSEMIVSLEVLPDTDSVVIRYETDSYVRGVIKWGRTTSYELGSLAEDALSKTHETVITGLSPGVIYYFTIEGEDRIGRYGTMYTGTFTTLPPEDTFPPANVLNLRATRDGDDVVLSWTNPDDPDFANLRVMRSDRFYPIDTADGWFVYEGTGETFRDEGAAATGALRQYYTVFSYDELGNISSGAFVSVYLGPTSTSTPGVTAPETEEEEPLPPEEQADETKDTLSLELEDLEFVQDDLYLTPRNGVVTIDGSKRLTISIPYERLPEHLKAILVVIRDSRNVERTFKFLLRVNDAKTAYTSLLAPLGTSGDFPIEVSVFDFTTTQVGYTRGTLTSEITPIHTEPEPLGGFLAYLSEFGRSFLLWFILLLILLAVLGRRLVRTQY